MGYLIACKEVRVFFLFCGQPIQHRHVFCLPSAAAAALEARLDDAVPQAERARAGAISLLQRGATHGRICAADFCTRG